MCQRLPNVKASHRLTPTVATLRLLGCNIWPPGIRLWITFISPNVCMSNTRVWLADIAAHRTFHFCVPRALALATATGDVNVTNAQILFAPSFRRTFAAIVLPHPTNGK